MLEEMVRARGIIGRARRTRKNLVAAGSDGPDALCAEAELVWNSFLAALDKDQGRGARHITVRHGRTLWAGATETEGEVARAKKLLRRLQNYYGDRHNIRVERAMTPVPNGETGEHAFTSVGFRFWWAD